MAGYYIFTQCVITNGFRGKADLKIQKQVQFGFTHIKGPQDMTDVLY